MTWLEFARILKKALEHFRAFLADAFPGEKKKPTKNKPPKKYGDPPQKHR